MTRTSARRPDAGLPEHHRFGSGPTPQHQGGHADMETRGEREQGKTLYHGLTQIEGFESGKSVQSAVKRKKMKCGGFNRGLRGSRGREEASRSVSISRLAPRRLRGGLFPSFL